MKYILPLLTFGAIYFGADYKESVAGDKPIAENTVTENKQIEDKTQTTPTNQPKESTAQATIGSLEKEIKQAFVDSRECDRVRWADFKGDLVLACDEILDGKYATKYSINLSDMCDVHLKENYHWYIFEWLGGDDVIVSSTYGIAISMRFWDKHAEKIYNLLNEYIQKNPNMEVEKCLK